MADMNETLLMEDLTDLNNSLQHAGRLGMKWRTFGASGATRWQSGAVYAQGKSDPSEKKLKSSSKKKKNNENEKAPVPKASEMSDTDLRQKTERLRLENAYEQAIQDQMRNVISRRRLETEFRNTLKSPKKKSKVISSVDRLANKFIDKTIDKTIDVGVNVLVDVAKGKVAKSKGPEYAERIFKEKKKK